MSIWAQKIISKKFQKSFFQIVVWYDANQIYRKCPYLSNVRIPLSYVFIQKTLLMAIFFNGFPIWFWSHNGRGDGGKRASFQKTTSPTSVVSLQKPKDVEHRNFLGNPFAQQQTWWVVLFKHKNKCNKKRGQKIQI